MKKILLLEPDKEQAELFIAWLKGESYGVSLIDKPGGAQGVLANEEFDILLMDIDEPEITEPSLKLVQTLKADKRFAGLPIIVLAYKKDTKKIITAIEAGVDSFVLKPFETDPFLKRIEVILKEFELKSKGNKVLDLNYVNYLIALAGEMEREDFFLLAQVIFNTLILGKINTILGEPIIAQIVKRCDELIGEDYVFMREVKLLNGQLLMDGVDNASRGIPDAKLTNAFRDYVYAFLQLVHTLTSDILMERGGG